MGVPTGAGRNYRHGISSFIGASYTDCNIMRDLAFKYRLISLLLGVACLIILLLPFHALMTVWAASVLGHYTLLRLWKEYLVLALGLAVIWLLISDSRLRSRIFKTKLVWVIIAYALVDFIIAGVAYSQHKVSTKAMAYGLLDDLRFLIFFVICWAIAIKTDRFAKRWQKLIIWPAVIVVGFGLLQMSVLPADFLSHFGYGATTIPPYQTINNNIRYIRILSTLRGADPLGAYLILPISALIVLLVRYPKSRTWAKILLLIGSLAVLFGSYSRSAWIGAFLGCVFIGLSLFKRDFVRRYKLHLSVAAMAAVVLIGVSAYAFGASSRFQNIIFHYQSHSSSPISSDQAHLKALAGGVKTVVDQPFGNGPGTSGPASLYNHYGSANIPENYFLEVGEESGILGMLLFVAINVIVGYELWRRRDSAFAMTMLAALIGITFVNLLLLAWTDDTLSYIWWGLAGAAMTLPTNNQPAKANNKDRRNYGKTKY